MPREYSDSRTFKVHYALNTYFFKTISGQVADYWRRGTMSGEESRSGETNPYWRRQVATGNNATTVFSGQIENWFPLSIYARQEYAPKNPNATGDLYDYGICKGTYLSSTTPFYVSDISNLPEVKADNAAKAAFVSKIRKTQTSFQGGTFVGELGKTIAGIKNPLKHLRGGINSYLRSVQSNGVRAIRRSRNRKVRVRNLKDAIADTWLEYAFHWTPLAMEIDSGVKTVIDYMYKKTPPWKMVVGYGEADLESDYLSDKNAGTNTYPYVKYSRRRRKGVKVKYYGLVGIDTYGTKNVRRLGFDASNMLPTIWELVPYSFLIDYFVNVDDIISAATLSRAGVRWISKTTIREGEEIWYNPRVVLNYSSFGTYSGYQNSSQGVTYRVRTVNRSPYVGSLVPSLQLSLPTLPKQLMNISALVTRSKAVTELFLRTLR